MKIIHIITSLNTGGAEVMLYKVLSNKLNKKFDNYVISMRDMGSFGAKIENLGVKVITLNMQKKWHFITAIFKLISLAIKISPNVIQGWMPHGNVAAFFMHIFARNSLLSFNIRQSLYDISLEKYFTQIVIKLNKFLSKYADTIIYNSIVAKQQHEEFGFCSNKAIVIANGFDIEKFCFSMDARLKIRVKLNIAKTAIVIGHIARFHPMKDHKNFIQAAKKVLIKNPAIHFIMSGTDVDSNNNFFNDNIGKEIKNNFHLLGNVDNVHNLMSAIDIMVSSSSYGEAFPNILGEAMACSVLCVATNVGDSKYIIDKFGKIVPVKDSTALAIAIIELSSLTTKQKNQLTTGAYNRVKNNFSLSIISNKYINVYENIS